MSVRQIVWWLHKLDETREEEAEAIKSAKNDPQYAVQ